MSFLRSDRTAAPAVNTTADGKIVVVLSGNFCRTGTVEVEPGTKLSDIVYQLAGGVRQGSELKAIQIGGPWGGLVPIGNLDLVFDSESLAKVGCSIGDGSIAAVDATGCMVNFAYKASVIAHRTVCGECTFGREGTRQFVDVLKDLTTGRGTLSDLDLLRRVGEGMKVGSLCTNGATAPHVVLTAMEQFRAEFEAHANDKQCPSNICTFGGEQK